MRKYKMTPRGLGTSSGKCFVCGRQTTYEDFASFIPSIEILHKAVKIMNKSDVILIGEGKKYVAKNN